MSSTMSQKKLLAAVMLASTGAAAYYIWKYMKQTQTENPYYEELDIPNSVYNIVKTLAKQSFETRQLILVESVEDWEKAYTILSQDLEHVKVLGMDCEWVTRDKKRQPVSMLQLSTLNCTALVRIHLLHNIANIPESLVNLLEDRSIIKPGVGALDDRDKILSDYGVAMTGCIDLRHMALRHRKSWNGGGLKKLAMEICGITLDKSDSLRRGNWEADELSMSMQNYAAGDSEAGIAMFLCLVALKLQTAPELETDDVQPLLHALQKRSGAMCHGILDIKYSMNPLKKGYDAPKTSSLRVPNNNPGKCISSNALRSRAMYSNCVMQAPDGQVLCVCDVKKALWYCDKELADKVSKDEDEELVIRLRFEPRGRPTGERDYYRSRKENICVVCGADKSFIRKNIIPREYRKHFPEILKSHSSHDVVLLCASCHKKSGVFDQQYKTYFAQLCDAPYKSGGVMVDSDLKKVKSAARTLSGYADKLPAAKLEECRQTICQFYGTDEITDDVLESACSLEDRSSEPLEHGRLVVEYYLEKSTLQVFQKLWRQRFLDIMKPQHLGDYWHVDYDHMDYLWVKEDPQAAES